MIAMPASKVLSDSTATYDAGWTWNSGIVVRFAAACEAEHSYGSGFQQQQTVKAERVKSYKALQRFCHHINKAFKRTRNHQSYTITVR